MPATKKKAAKKKPKVRSGTLWSDDDYAAAGYGRLGVRLPVTALGLLERHAKKRGLSRAQFLTELITQAGGPIRPPTPEDVVAKLPLPPGMRRTKGGKKK